MNPYLQPRRAEPLIAFLKRTFGAEEVAKYTSPDGVVDHGIVRVGNSILEMGEAHGKHTTMEAMFYLYVPNMEAVYRQALAAGATSFQEPTDQPYGDPNAGVKDNFGNKGTSPRTLRMCRCRFPEGQLQVWPSGFLYPPVLFSGS